MQPSPIESVGPLEVKGSAMPSAEYIVMRRAGNWSYMINGDSYGPFQNQIAAQNAAIFEAKHCGRTGGAARVSVDEPNGGLPVIFDTATE